MQLEEFNEKFLVLARGMQAFVDPPMLDGYYLVLGSLTLSDLEWLTVRVLTDPTMDKLPPAPQCLSLILERDRESVLMLPSKTPEQLETDRVITREGARRWMQIIRETLGMGPRTPDHDDGPTPVSQI